MTEAVTCPQCGSELPSNAPAGMCPRCLMEAALADSSDENQAQADSPYAETTPQPRSFLPPESGLLADQFPHLEILELLGQGGMGAVYKARQPKLDRLVALKIIRPESADDPTFAERFNREAKTLARLNHPNIVGVHDFGEVTLTDEASGESPKTLYYFLMEYVDGANLRQMMDRGELSPAQALSIAPQICEALQFAHDEGVVHRDIKPENILVDSRGRVKIADFGLAKLATRSEEDFTLTGTHQVMGTPRYMAPEQMAGSRAVDHRADLYSLGVVFYEMLTGQVPAGHFSPPSQHAAIDVRLDDVVMKALAQKPEDRFQGAREIRASLETISKEQSGAVFSEPELPPARGLSTVFEREIGAAWNWVVHPEKPDRESDRKAAAFPRLLFITLAVLGALTIFVPWAVLQIDKGRQIDLTASGEGSTVVEAVSETYRGTEIWSSSAAAGCCLLVALVLILTPYRRSPGWIAVGLMLVFSIVAVVHTLTYPNELNSHAYVDLRVEVTPETARWLSPDSDLANRQNVENGTARGVISHPLSLWSFSDDVRFREGYYGALAISVTLVLLNIVAVRNLILNREPKPETSQSWSGTPMASLRFQVPAKGDLDAKIRFHFQGLGYELIDERAGAWIFQRGTAMGGLLGTDIRVFPTRLSVHAMRDEDGGHLINCHWSVRLMGGFATSKDSDKLESEGRELQALLGSRIDRPDDVSPSELRFGEHFEKAVVPDVLSSDESHSPANRADVDLVAVEDEVSGPAIAMIVVGAVAILGAAVGSILLALAGDLDFESVLFLIVPPILVGIAMIVGGLCLKRLSSRAWAQTGIVAGMLPVTPAWIMTIGVCVWAQMTIRRKPEVERAFRERARQRVEQEVSGPAIAMMVAGFLMMLGHGIAGLAMASGSDPTIDELAVMAVPGIFVGLAMLIGGFFLHDLRSQRWAHVGIIAGFLPVSPAFIVTMMTSVIALNALSKPRVKLAFRERKNRRWDELKRRRTRAASSPSAGVDFVAIEEEVSGPALTLMVVGFLMLVGHTVFMAILLPSHEAETSPFLIPGILIGLGMMLAGYNLKRLRSKAWVQLGIIAGFIPGGPGWLLSLPVCLWANSIFRRKDVQRAFLERARRRRSPSADTIDADVFPVADIRVDDFEVEETVSSPSIALMIVGFLMLAGHMVFMAILLPSHESEMSPILIPGILIGLGMMIAGFNLKRLQSRAWVQLGIIAGFFPGGPGWLLSLPVCLWANSVFRREDVQRAFLERARRLRAQPFQNREEQTKFVQQAMLLSLAVWSLMAVVGGMVSFGLFRNDLGSYYIADGRAGWLEPKSEAYQYVRIRAIGQDNAGHMSQPDQIPLRMLEFELEPLLYSPYQGADGTLRVKLDTFGYEIGMEHQPPMTSPIGFDPGIVERWMSLSGVSLHAEGVEKEARALFEIANRANETPPHQSIDRSLFNVQQGTITTHIVPYQAGQHARYCLYVWLAGVALIVVVTLSRTESRALDFGRLIARVLAIMVLLVVVAGAMYLLLAA